MSYFKNIKQDVTADTNNSYSGEVAALGSIVGTSTSTLGIAGIQVSLKNSTNCNVYIEQSPDGINWDISDRYNYYYSINNFGLTVQAINSYVRVRVDNLQNSIGSPFRLQTALCPIVEAVPRSLDDNGNFKVAIQSIGDEYGFEVENTPTNEMRVVEPTRLVGAAFIGNTIDPNFWTTTTTSGGTITQGNGQNILRTNVLSGATTTLQSIRKGRYVGANANIFRSILRIPDDGTTGNLRRWGAYDGIDGAFYQLSGTTFGLGLIKGGSETIINTGSFNGKLGGIYSPGSKVMTYEIYWTNSKVWYSLGGDLVHTYSADYDTWCNTLTLPVRLENKNTSTASGNVSLNVRAATISRLGKAQTTSTYYHSTASGNYVLKYGAGNLHTININGAGAVGNQLTIYDNVAASGQTIAIYDISKATGPQSYNFDQGINFNNGLTIGQIGTFDATILYE